MNVRMPGDEDSGREGAKGLAASRVSAWTNDHKSHWSALKWLALIVGVTTLVVGVFVALNNPDFLIHRDQIEAPTVTSGPVTPPDPIDLELKRQIADAEAASRNRTTILAVIAGLLALIGGYINWRSLRTTEQSLRHSRESHATSTANELYATAATQLGSEDSVVRLAGLYTFDRLGQQRPELRQTIFEVWCAYLRAPFTPVDGLSHRADAHTALEPAQLSEQLPRPTEAEVKAKREQAVRDVCQQLIQNHLRPDQLWPEVQELNLAGAHLKNADFGGAKFKRSASFHDATFTGLAWFQGAAFAESAWFNGASFLDQAAFEGATFNGFAFFSGATFTYAVGFGSAWFNGQADFESASFLGPASFSGQPFDSDPTFEGPAIYSNLPFAGATFAADARFEEARFSRMTWFDGVSFCAESHFRGAAFDDDARFANALFKFTPDFAQATNAPKISPSQIIGNDPTQTAMRLVRKVVGAPAPREPIIGLRSGRQRR